MSENMTSAPSGSGYGVAVVGATGAVGTTMLAILLERNFPVGLVRLYGSERSAGRRLGDAVGEGASVPEPFADAVVGGLSEEALEGVEGVDLALFSAGSGVSREWAPRFADAGAVVIDNSSCWRMEPDVPLVVAEVNPDALAAHRGIVANPNCSTMQMVVALKPIHDAAGIERIVVSTYQSTSGTGVRAVRELQDQSHAILHGAEPEPPAVYPHRIAFNVLPQVEAFREGDDYTTEERKMMAETRRILGDDSLRVSATCARVPVVTGHSESINVQTREDLPPERCRELLSAAPGVTVIDDPADGLYPLAVDAAGRDDVFVGRIRRDPSNERTLNLWVVSDNLRKGAALNAVQLAELLHQRGLIAPATRSAA
jgi:aspartate-semialdehyde dehydrogenase